MLEADRGSEVLQQLGYSTQELGFDPAVMKAKYLAERDKRVRPDGNDQYIEVTAEFSNYVDDPYVEPGFARDPVHTDVDFTIIGAGFGGLVAGVRLREAGVNSIRLIDKAGDVGGTWYWNRYPGAACDVEAYVYLPLLEEVGGMPSTKYPFQPEILEHSRRIARYYNLYDDALFQTGITELRWDEAARRWVIKTDRGDEFRSQFVVMANGPLNRPKLPGIPGINEFKGYTFHTSRWDYGYTGGDSTGGLDKLGDKVVGIIGTGATAVQCVPHLGASAKHLYVFQRTPSSVDVRDNRPTDPEWFNSLPKGWQQERIVNFNDVLCGEEVEQDLVGDGWTDIFRNLTWNMTKPASRALGRPLKGSERRRLMELADAQKMNQVRHRIGEIVEDKATAEALKPWYRQFCKRPCFHDEYLPTFNRPNVTLVDTNGRGVERLTEDGVVVDGTEYKVDCLIFATGFETGTLFTRRAGYDIIGRGGQTISEKWKDGPQTFHGVQTNGFPNCFFIGLNQTAVTISIPMTLGEQAKHIAYIVTHAQELGGEVVEASVEAEQAWVEEFRRAAHVGRRFYEECTPGYYNSEGNVSNPLGLLSGAYLDGPVKFFKILEDFRANANLPGLVVTALETTAAGV
jgi:cyclohexanone monooxygenase